MKPQPDAHGMVYVADAARTIKGDEDEIQVYCDDGCGGTLEVWRFRDQVLWLSIADGQEMVRGWPFRKYKNRTASLTLESVAKLDALIEYLHEARNAFVERDANGR